MKFEEKNPPRSFTVGTEVKLEKKDCGSMALGSDEQVTFTTEAGGEYDVARKDWGFYATPSLNGRLQQFGLRAVLIRNRISDRYFVVLVERHREAGFHAYLSQENCEVVAWLDSSESLNRLRSAVSAAPSSTS